MDQPLVTVVIPLYNHNIQVIDAIKSILDQDYPNKQVVIVDDASTEDVSLSGFQEFLGVNFDEKDTLQHVKVMGTDIFYKAMSKNRGRAATRNEGIKVNPSSPIFAFLDADDQYLLGKISKSVAKLMEDPENVGVVYSDYISFNHETNVGVPELRPPFDVVQMRQNCLINNDSIVNAKALQAVGLYDESMEVAEDYDLWLRVTTRFAAVHIPELLLQVGVSNTNASKTVNPDVWQKNWNTIRMRMQAGVY